MERAPLERAAAIEFLPRHFPFRFAMAQLPLPPATPLRRSGALLLGCALLLAGCTPAGPSPEAQRLERLELRLQQLEQRLNTLSRERDDGADRKGKPPAGVIKSLTIRTGSEDDRLRIYWADGSTTDLPCTKEQSTFACG
jgi:hypothetical protein